MAIIRFRTTEVQPQSTAQPVPFAQAVLEALTGRDLDPVEVAYTSESVPVGRGYHQSILVRTERNLRTNSVTVTREKGGVA
ncbi:MAG: hypothetical protein E6Q97_29950 [Desulfurellales bacterium]|nr:MAG: hypothetical protein E6Q97_29950 [Desulfurellales bacterium]